MVVLIIIGNSCLGLCFCLSEGLQIKAVKQGEILTSRSRSKFTLSIGELLPDLVSHFHPVSLILCPVHVLLYPRCMLFFFFIS